MYKLLLFVVIRPLIGTGELNYQYLPPMGIQRAVSPCYCEYDKDRIIKCSGMSYVNATLVDVHKG